MDASPNHNPAFVCVVVISFLQPQQDKITNIDGVVGREGWRSHITLGNGVVRWTDDFFDRKESNTFSPKNVNDKGKSMFLFPNELDPMYSSFSPDKIYRWKVPQKKKKMRKKANVLTKEQIVAINEIRRGNMEGRGSVHGCRPKKKAHSPKGKSRVLWDGTFNYGGGLRKSNNNNPTETSRSEPGGIVAEKSAMANGMMCKTLFSSGMATPF